MAESQSQRLNHVVVKPWLPAAASARRIDGPLSPHDSRECLASQFLHIAARRFHRSAVITPRGNWLYADIVQGASALASTLIQANAGELGGKCVVLKLANSPEYVASFFGILLAGGVVVPLPPTIEEHAFQRIVAAANPMAVVSSTAPTAATSNRQPSQVLADAAAIELDFSTAGALSPTWGEPRSLKDLAALFFTAGSTGDPKGVMLSHENLVSNARSIIEYLDISENERPLCVLPFYHAFGNSVLQSHLLAGATLVIDGQPTFPESIVTAMSRHRATSLSGVPDLFQMLLERSSLGKTLLPDLRTMAVAGGSLRRELALLVLQRVAPARFFVMYGQTEATARLAYLPPESLPHVQAGCIGRAIPGVELAVFDDAGERCPDGVTGELRARGPNIMLGYYRDPSGTNDRIVNGWLRTGDLASRETDGWLYHRGRSSAIVKIAGFRVHPGELEEFAIRRLGTTRAVAVAFELPQVGARLALFIQSDDSSPIVVSEHLSRCRSELPRHLVPEFIECLPELPLNHALKPDRPRLVCMAEERGRSKRASA